MDTGGGGGGGKERERGRGRDSEQWNTESFDLIYLCFECKFCKCHVVMYTSEERNR